MQLSDCFTFRPLALLVLALAIAPLSAFPAECAKHSGETIVPLVELYTSEGCSSCPPADKWLSSIKGSGLNVDKVVPLAFHVDYWDYIGWKDRFARPDFSARQTQANNIAGSSFVYTPQVMFNGADYRAWHESSSFNTSINNSLKQPTRANLSVSLAPLPTGEIALKTLTQNIAAADRKNADVFIAVYENNLKSSIKAGENNGRELAHDYVVREWFGPFRVDEKDGSLQKNLTLKPEWKGRDAGIATFVQDRSNGNVLQAISLPFCS